VSATPGHPVVGALSPSRAGDYLTCALLYRFRTIDRLPERPGLAAFRGTLVHEVLDRLFDLPSSARTVDQAARILPEALVDLLDDEPEAAFALVEDAEWPADEPPQVPEAARAALLTDATALLERYFTLEDPRQIEPTHREQFVEVALDPDLLLRGYVDRMDETDGRLRVVDYKTGRSPGQQWEQQAMFQLRFYALVVQRATGRIPGRLQLLYLGNGEVLTYQPDEDDLDRFARKLRAMWTAITRAADAGDWRPRTSAKCKWCSFQSMCPEFGGTPPPLPPMPDGESSTTVVT
jgi:putative RecB family exonuclease